VTALLFRVGMLGFDAGVLARFGLAASRLPAREFPLALRLLAVARVPAPRLVLAPATLAQADPQTSSAGAGRMALETRTRRLHASLSSGREPERELKGLTDAQGTRSQSAAVEMIESAAEPVIGPTGFVPGLGRQSDGKLLESLRGSTYQPTA
jgi:hypothetical protein